MAKIAERLPSSRFSVSKGKGGRGLSLLPHRPFDPEPENSWPLNEVAFPEALWLAGETEEPF